jgi:septal ring factor EnvC (AmiA/AmiB activator)
MASANVKARCVTCGKERATSKCGGCLQDFCYKHLGDHRQELSKELDEVEVMRDLFRQTVNEQKSDPGKHSIIQQIDKWERDSIKKIRQTAEEARQFFHQHISVHFIQIESKLNRLTDQLRQSREEEDFFESDIRQWNKELTQLAEQLAKPSDITVYDDQTPLITKISVNVSSNRGNPRSLFFSVRNLSMAKHQLIFFYLAEHCT